MIYDISYEFIVSNPNFIHVQDCNMRYDASDPCGYSPYMPGADTPPCRTGDADGKYAGLEYHSPLPYYILIHLYV